MTDNLIFNVAQLLKEPIGAIRTGEIEADLYRLAPDLALSEDAPDSALTGPVRMMHTDLGVLVQTRLAGQATMACVRCLEPVAVPLDVEVEEVFTPTIDLLTGQTVAPNEDDKALWINDHHILDLTEVVRQDALLAAPMHVLCREDCRGLCPTCGANLNAGPCACEPEPDPRWAALTALLKESQVKT